MLRPIVQKAYRAGVGAVAAVSGVTSLSVDFAARVGIILVGFIRDGRFRVYSGRAGVRTPAGSDEDVRGREGERGGDTEGLPQS